MDHLPEASTASRESIHCGCNKGCTGCCKCKKAAFKCTALCQCSGEHKISLLNTNFKFNELLIVNSLPQSPGGGGGGMPIVACNILPQQCPPWYTALLICCKRVALVGGMASID